MGLAGAWLRRQQPSAEFHRIGRGQGGRQIPRGLGGACIHALLMLVTCKKRRTVPSLKKRKLELRPVELAAVVVLVGAAVEQRPASCGFLAGSGGAAVHGAQGEVARVAVERGVAVLVGAGGGGGRRRGVGLRRRVGKQRARGSKE